MKACPGLRSGIASRLVTPSVEDMPRTRIRRRNPGGGNVGRGLVPRWGRGGEWQNPPCQSTVPNHNSNFSYLGMPAADGMGDWYENDVTWPRNCPNATTLQSTSMPTLHRRILPSRRPMVDGGMGKHSAGACPPPRAHLEFTHVAKPGAVPFSSPHVACAKHRRFPLTFQIPELSGYARARRPTQSLAFHNS